MYPELEGRTALVTGAGQGIGRGIALALAEAKVDVAVNVRSSVDRAEETVELARAHGVKATVHQADVADRDAVFRMVEQVVADHGRVDICVNNAGGGLTFGVPLEELEPEAWHRPFEIALEGTFNCCQAVGRHLVARGYWVSMADWARNRRP